MDKGKRLIVDEEDEEEPIHIPGEKEVNETTISLCLLGKLWTDRPYNKYGLFETMKKLWCPSKGMICRDMGANLISFQFNSKRDMDRVIAMEPWHFNKHVLVLSPILNDIQPSQMQFNKTPFWIRVYDVPIMGRKEAILKQIGARFGEVLEIDSSTIDGVAKSIRMRIILDLSKPIKRGTKLQIGTAAPCWIPATYERLPSFCYWCGLLGHTSKDCDKLHDMEDEQGQITEDEMPYGDFLKASPMKNLKVVTDKMMGVKKNHQRSLFQTTIAQHPDEEESDRGKNKNMNPLNGKPLHAPIEMSDIMQSLSRVHVNTPQSETEAMEKLGNIGDDNTPLVQKLSHTSSQSEPPLQPKPNHTTQTQTPKPLPEYTPTPILIAMVNSQTCSSHKSPKTQSLVQPKPIREPTKPINLPSNPPSATTKPSILPPHPNKPTGCQPASNSKPHGTQGLLETSIMTQKSHTTTQNNPTIQPPINRTKLEEKLPISKCVADSQSTQKKWKRIEKGAKQHGNSTIVGVKRRNDDMEIDNAFDGQMKKTKNSGFDSSMATAKTATQSRRTL